ncbi:MAG: tetratricopeptide repeat protein [Chloroflexota bacterium]
MESVQILALLSEPLVDSRGQPNPRLNPTTAATIVRQQLEGMGRAAVLRFAVATPDHFLNALRQNGPFDLIHFYGHGGQGALAFEDGRGAALAVDSRRLQTLLSPLGRPPAPVALLSACHSQSMAEAFVAAGVSHVVAIDSEQAVLEVAARAFAAHFYPSLLAGQSVRQAFDFGRAAVFNDPTVRQTCQFLAQTKPELQTIVQAHDVQYVADLLNRLEVLKFHLLPEASAEGADPHQVIPFPSAPAGRLEVHELPAPPPTIVRRPEFFTGREPELHELIGSVLDHQLTTVTGTGGMGKSELCRETGRWLAAHSHFAGGITFVPLGALTRADDARQTIAVALKLDPQQTGTPAALGRLLPRDSLLILDEPDRLLHEDTANTRALLQALYDYGQGRLLLASRYRAGVTGERVYPLKRLPPAEATRLFMQLAPPNLAGTEAELAEVMAFLDGFPRAIVQAARQMTDPHLSWLLADLRASREEILHDPLIPAEERQDGDSVLVTLNSSYRRLQERHPAAAAFFPLLSLFPAGVGEEGLRAIFGAEARLAQQVLELALVEITPPLGYYYLPAPVRSYAARRRPPMALDQIGAKALAYYHQVANQYDDLILEGKIELGVALFAAEFPNLESFLAWGYEHETAAGDPPVCYSARITGLFQNFFVIFDPGRTQIERYRQALTAARRIKDRLGEANVLQAIGDVQNFRDEREAALQSYQEALRLFRQVGDRLGEANVLQAIGDVQNFRKDMEAALQSYQEALRLFRQVGARLGEANVLQAIGDVQNFRKDMEAALQSYQEALRLFRQVGDRLGEANVLLSLGDLRRQLEDWQAAWDYYQQVADLYAAIGDGYSLARVLYRMGDWHVEQGEPAAALPLYDQAIALWRARGLDDLVTGILLPRRRNAEAQAK